MKSKMTTTDYLRIKHLVIYEVARDDNHYEVSNASKELFKDGINSVRRFEQIKSIDQLLQVLEIRDILSEENVECLKRIALKLPDSRELLKRIIEYEDVNIPKENGNYYGMAQNIKMPQEESFIMTSNSSLTKNMSTRKKQRIFKTIIEDIGSFWRDLGRNLKIRESDIDNIDCQNKSLAEKASKIMYTYEHEKADPDRWFFVLCDALEKCRRKDLVRSIQEIMAMNI